MRNKWRNYGFLLSFVSAVLLAVKAFGIDIDVPYVNGIVESVLGVLVVAGIVTGVKKGGGKDGTVEADSDEKNDGGETEEEKEE